MKTIFSALAGSLCLGGLAQAQTTTLIDATLNVPTSLQDTIAFTVTAPGSEFIEAAYTSSPLVLGVGILTYNGAIADVFSLTNGAANSTQFNTVALTNSGIWSFYYDFANSNSSVGNTAYLNAVVTSNTAGAPEIDAGSATTGLTLLIGGLLVMRGRRATPGVA